jgi:hypothetical protein
MAEVLARVYLPQPPHAVPPCGTTCEGHHRSIALCHCLASSVDGFDGRHIGLVFAQVVRGELQVPVAKVGLVIGARGSTLRELEARHGCRAQVDNTPRGGFKTLICDGPRRAVDALLLEVRAIARMLPEVRRVVHIPGEVVGLVIGAGGEMLRRIQRLFNVRVVRRDPVPPSHCHEVVVSGLREEDVARACVEVEVVAHLRASVRGEISFAVSSDLPVEVLEHGHPTLVELSAATSCTIELGRGVNAAGQRVVVLRGPWAQLGYAEARVWRALGVVVLDQHPMDGCPLCVFGVPNGTRLEEDDVDNKCPHGRQYAIR